MKKLIAVCRLLPLSVYLFFIATLLVLFLPENIIAQKNKGLPFITNYRYQDYNAGGVNWWAAEDDKGVMYFANNQGVLLYDGQQWETVVPPGINETRSLVKGDDGKIYVGTNGDIGYIGQGKKGKLEFISLKNKIPEIHRKFNEVWETQNFNGDIFFRATNKMFRWNGTAMKVYESKEGFHVGDVVNNQYYVRIWGRGLTILKEDSLHVVPNGEKFANERIYAYIPYDQDRMLIGTRTQGLFIYDGKDFTPFKTEADAYLVNKSLYGGIRLSNGNFAFNNFNDGIVIIDKEGKLVQLIDKTVGLMDNAADYVFEDSRGILWIPLFNGIAKFDLNSSLTYYNETMGLPGKAVFNIGIINDTVYAGTNTGVYMLNKNINRFEKLAGSSGQIGNFILNGNDLLVAAADNGLQKIKGGKIVPVITSVNYNFNMNGFQRSKKDTTLFYCSLRSGTAIVKYNPLNGIYSILSFNPDISISNSVNIETEEGNLWIPGENPGEVRLLKLYENGVHYSLEKTPIIVYNSSHGLPERPIFMVEYDGKSYYYSEKDSIFVFDKNQNRFVQDKNAIWSKSFVNNATGTSFHEPDQLGRIWANSGSGVYVKLPTADGSVKIIDAPFRELRKNYPVWSITPTIDKNGKEVVWFSSNEGVIRYDGNLTEAKVDSIHTIIRSITLNEDSVFYSGFDLSASKPDFSHKWNTIRFQFAAPFFKQENETLFSTYLDGWDKGWSEWSKQNFREFGNLSGGTYTFRVKSKNIYDIESAEVSYTFSVSPPWYGSWWAYILYAIIAAVIIYLIVRWRTQHLHEKHRELEKVVAERTYQLSHRVEELAVINSVQEGLVSEMNMSGIYELVGEKIREIFDAQVIDIVTYDNKTNLLEDRYAFEKGDRTLVGSWEPKGFRKHVIETGQLLLINKDLDQKSVEFGSSVIHGEQPKSAVFVPMISRGKVMGMISLQNLDKENAFSDSSVNLLTTLANSMSVALESAKRFDETTRLLKETEQRTAELAVINSVQDGLARELDIHGIYKLVGDRLCTLFPDSQTLVIRTFNHLSNQEYFEYFIEKGEHMKVDPRPFMWANKQLIQTKQALLINEDYVETAKKYGSTGVTKGQPPKSAVFVPMIVGDVVKGSISLQNVDKEFGYSDSDLRLLTTLTNSMSVALENARLFDETNRLLKETEQRNAELAVINSVQDGLVREMDMQGIYELVGEKIREIFDAQVIDIVTYDKKANLIEDRYAYEKGDRSLLGPRPPKGFRRHVIETKTLLLHNENVEQAMKDYNNEILIGEVPKSQVYVPMIAGSEVNGIISLQNIDHEQAFSESDVRLLNTLANSMSIALESARLFDETKRLLKETEQRNAELAVINSVQDGLVREMDMEGIYELVGEKIREIFDAQVIDIVMYDRKTKMIEDRYSYEKGDRTLLGPRKPFGFRKHVIENKVEMMINRDLEKLSVEYNSPVIQGETPKSMIMVPMVAGNNVTGIISLQNIDHEDAFSESDARLINTLANTMSIALESARLFDETKRLLKETKQRNAELAVINSVQDGLVREMDMQGIYELVGEKIREIFDAQVIDIVTYDSRTNLIEDRYSYEKGDRSLLGPRAPKGFRKHVIDTGQLLLHNDNVERAMREFDNEIMIGEMPKSQVYVPMITGGEVNGIISLQNIDHEHAFSESDIRLINTLANTMSIALGSARLFDETKRLLKETEQRTAELSVINSVQEGLVKEMDIQGIYNLVGEKMRAIFNAQVFDIVTYDKSSGLIEDRYTYEKGDRTLLGPRPLKGFRKHVIDTARPLVINNNLDEQRLIYDQKVLTGEGARSLVMVPMIAAGEATGVISLQNLDQENAFPDSDVRLLGTLASSMSVALENARLFDETTRLLKETEQRTAELAVINSVQDGLAKELDIQGIYDLVGERIRALFDAQVVAIATFNHEEQTEKFQYMVEKGERFYAEPRPLGKLRLHLIKTRQKVIINKLEEGYAWFGSEVIPGTEPIKSAVFVPLIIGDKITSYVTLQNIDRENAFSEADIRLLETLANSMSVALENARLFDETTRLLKETEQRTAELAVINSVQDGLATELDIQGIYNLVGDRIRDLFDAQVVAIATFNHENATEKFQYIVEKGERFYPEARPFDKLRTHLIATRQKILINSDFIEAYNKFGMKAVSGTALPKSALFVPLSIGEKITSYVTLQNIDRENAFSDSDVRLLETLANSMSVALENARLFDETNRLLKETEQRTAELAVINSVQEGLVREMDMQGIYNLVGDRVQTLFNAQVVIIATFELENKTEHFNYFFENNEKLKAEPRPINHLRQLLIDKKHTIHIATEEEAKKDYGLSPIGDTKMTKSLLFVPLLTGSIIRGYVSLQNIDTEHAFSESDIRLLETLANSMSVALENARLFDETNRLLKETEQRTAELAVINSVQDGLAKELDIQGIYDLVGDRLCDLFPDTQTLVIRTFDHESGLEHFQYAIEKGERLEVEARPFMWANQQLIRLKKPIDIEENYVRTAQKFGGSGVTKGKPPKSAVFVPMIVGDVVKGSISLQNVDRENAFNASDLRLLTTITNSMSVALENARLFDETHRLLKETEQRTAELAVINSVQDGLVREMNMQAIYDLVGNRICELFDTQTVLIRTFDHRSGLETWQYVIEKGERLYSNPRPFIWANKRLIETKESLLINENYLETAQKFGGSGVTKGLPPKSALFVPMIVGDVVKGSVSLQNVEKENAFTDSDLRLLTTLTNSMSVALENARLFDESNRLLSDAKQRASELATVNNITQALASQINLEELIDLVGDEIRQLFKANIVYLALLDKETNMINFPHQFGDTMEPMKLGEGLTSKIILTGESLLMNKDIRELEAQMGIKTVGIPAASYLGVPISIGDEVIGVLSVQSTEQENRFNEDDLRLLNTIATSVGVALRKAKLFEEIHMAKMDAEEAKKTAERANEAKSAFLSTVSHELRTPLTSVLGFAKIIKKRLDEKIFPITDRTDPKTAKTIKQIADNLDVVVSEGQRLTHLINDVLDLAKIEAGKMEWNSEPVSIPEITERAIAATTALFDANNLKLVKEIKTDIPDITGDKDKLIQVMVNLISNAVKFSLKGKVTIKVQQEKDEIIASITDTGIGIAPEDHAAVFEQFKQVGDTLTDKPKGTGLGLPICKEIVEHHGGRIWLDSELGKGSTFYVAIPITKSVSENVSRPIHLEDLVKQLKEQVAHSKLNIIGKASHILVVDDDDSIRSLLHQELGEAGYEIVEASNGKEALECVRKRRPDLIILDIMMPEMNGFDVAAVLKNDPNTMDIPIIVLSIVQDKTRGFRIGVDRYLTKPIDTGLLFNEIGSLLEQGKSKKKVMIVDEDGTTVTTLTDVLKAKGYTVMESNGKELMEKAVANQPDIIIMNSILTDKQDVVKSLRFEKGMENVLFLVYQ